MLVFSPLITPKKIYILEYNHAFISIYSSKHMKTKLTLALCLTLLLSLTFASAAYYDQYSTSAATRNYDIWKYKYDYDKEDLTYKVEHTWSSPQYNYYRENYIPDYAPSQAYRAPAYQAPTYQRFDSTYENSYRFSNHVTQDYVASRYGDYNSYYNSQYQSQNTVRQTTNSYNSYPVYSRSYTYNPPIYSPPVYRY